MKNFSTCHLLLVFVLLFTTLSFSFGYHSYSQAERKVVCDLSKALQQVVTKNTFSWMSQDSLKTYAKLQSLFDTPLSIHHANKEFAEALSIAELKETSGIQIQLTKEEKASTANTLPDNYLTSDTILWISSVTAAEATPLSAENIGITFQGYARCSLTTLLLLSNFETPLLFLLLALLSGIAFLWLRSRNKKVAERREMIQYGNLSLCCKENCFYNEHGERIKLTPQQYELMEMFYLSPSHLLAKTDICQALWPGKENADETLYTLIRRLKPVVEKCSCLKITAERGRYVLEATS
ncbi:MAG: helix-turn-helix domain-containing protein [Bacteroides sp.]